MIDRDKFLETFQNLYEKVKFQEPEGKNEIPVEKLLLNIMEIYSRGTFRGQIHIKIMDNIILSPRIEEETQWNRSFLFIE